MTHSRKRTDRAGLISGAAALSSAIFMMAVSTSAWAADPYPSGYDDGTDLTITLGAGVKTEPDYLGSDDYEIGFFPIIGVSRPDNGVGFTPGGFSFSPSVGINGGRDAGDNPALIGLDDIDFGVELGAKVQYETEFTRTFAAVRAGVSGHNGIVADLGFDLVQRPTHRWTVSAGPRATLATEDYFDTYFGVTAAESARSGLAAFDPDGGIASVGIEGEAIFAVTEKTNLHLRAGWQHLLGDAADSPIVEQTGSADQFTVGVGISRDFDLNLWGD